MAARLDHLVGCAWFWVWSLVGFGLALAAVSLGLILMVPLVLVAVWMASRETARRSAFGLLTGAGGLCLLVAWIQQGGDNLDAQPWFVFGLAFALTGVVAHARRGD